MRQLKYFNKIFPSPTLKLVRYMRQRAEFEKARWEIKEEHLDVYFKKGVRSFFGVVLNDFGDLLEDNKQPSFFMSYKTYSLN